jgi:hypothetical protein
VLDANGQSLAYIYSRETKAAANIAGVLTEDEAPASALGEFGLFNAKRRCWCSWHSYLAAMVWHGLAGSGRN